MNLIHEVINIRSLKVHIMVKPVQKNLLNLISRDISFLKHFFSRNLARTLPFIMKNIEMASNNGGIDDYRKLGSTMDSSGHR